MNLCVNGQNRDYPAALNVGQLLATLELNRDQVVVELNREILIADKYVDIQLKDGDTLEIIQFVGGG